MHGSKNINSHKTNLSLHDNCNKIIFKRLALTQGRLVPYVVIHDLDERAVCIYQKPLTVLLSDCIFTAAQTEWRTAVSPSKKCLSFQGGGGNKKQNWYANTLSTISTNIRRKIQTLVYNHSNTLFSQCKPPSTSRKTSSIYKHFIVQLMHKYIIRR